MTLLKKRGVWCSEKIYLRKESAMMLPKGEEKATDYF